jgi:hypothetical protein
MLGGEVRADRPAGQVTDLAVMVRGELKQVAPVGPDRVRGGVGVPQVGEEVAQVPGERGRGPQLPGHGRIHDRRLPFAKVAR